MSAPKAKIGELLVEEGLLTEKQLEDALHIQKERGGRIVEICIAEGYFDSRQFLKFLANTRTTASIDLLNYAIPREVISLLPPHFVIKHQVLPIDKMGKLLTVGMACPLDTATIKEMEEFTGCRIKPVLVGMNDVKVAINRYYGEHKPDFNRMLQNAAVSVDDPALLAGGRSVPAAKSHAAPAADLAAAGTPPVAAPPAAAPVLAKAESGIRMEGVIQLVRRLHSLPALPETVARIRKLADSPDTDAREVQRAIETDPAIVAKVISLANSATYGFQREVDTLDAATRLLGTRDIYNLVLSAAVIDYFKASKHFDYKRFWRHSRFCATASRVISQHCCVSDANTLFVAGLLHALGRVALAEVVPERYSEVDQESTVEAIIKHEELLFGIAHPEVGYMLADIWELPPDITIPIRYHRKLDQATEFRESVAVVGLAAIMTDAYGKVTRENVQALARSCRGAMSMLNIPEKDFIQILAETGRKFKQHEAEAESAS
jgi:HD-like signal output (HDOD) protein